MSILKIVAELFVGALIALITYSHIWTYIIQWKFMKELHPDCQEAGAIQFGRRYQDKLHEKRNRIVKERLRAKGKYYYYLGRIFFPSYW